MKSPLILACVAAAMASVSALAGVEQTVDALIPRLATGTPDERYAAQMELLAVTAHASRPGAGPETGALAKSIAAKLSDATIPQPARVCLVRQLEYVGGSESVPALTALLNASEAELRDCARRALEKNSAPAATDALRAALKQGGSPSWKIGLMQSLGERRDGQSVDLLVQFAGDPQFSATAMSALGKIADQPAVAALMRLLPANPGVAAEALATAAERLAASGDARAAAAIYGKLFASASTFPGRSVALMGLAKTDRKQAQPAIAKALAGDDVRLQAVAVSAAGLAYGKGASAALADLLPSLNTSGKVCVLSGLDASAETKIISLASDPAPEVAAAALERLGQVGTAAAIPVLLKVAANAASPAQKPAAFSLARIAGTDVDAAIAAQASQGEPKLRVAAINAIADRNQASALPNLLRYAAEADSSVSRAACGALAKIGTANELEPLARLVLSGKAPAAETALQAVASRAEDKSAAAKGVVEMTRNSDPQKLGSIFDVLAMLGGSEALATVSQFASSDNPDAKDAAIRALANWPDFAAGKLLLSVATSPGGKPVYNVLAVQGLARLVKSSDKQPAAARVEMALAGFKAAQRLDEKRLMLSALGSIADAKAADTLKPFLTDATLKADAGQAMINLAQSLPRNARATARNVAQAVKDANISADMNRKADSVLKR